MPISTTGLTSWVGRFNLLSKVHKEVQIKALVLKQPNGQVLIEYALIIALVSVLLIAILTAINDSIITKKGGKRHA